MQDYTTLKHMTDRVDFVVRCYKEFPYMMFAHVLACVLNYERRRNDVLIEKLSSALHLTSYSNDTALNNDFNRKLVEEARKTVGR